MDKDNYASVKADVSESRSDSSLHLTQIFNVLSERWVFEVFGAVIGIAACVQAAEAMLSLFFQIVPYALSECLGYGILLGQNVSSLTSFFCFFVGITTFLFQYT